MKTDFSNLIFDFISQIVQTYVFEFIAENMNYLASSSFNAQKMCGALCLQHKVNETLDNHVKGNLKITNPTKSKPQPLHINFI